MAGPPGVLIAANKPSTHNAHFKPYSPPPFLRARTFSHSDSHSTQESEPTPTPTPRHKLKNVTLLPFPNQRRGSSTALNSPSDLPSLLRVSPRISTTSSASENGDTDDEEIFDVLNEYNTEGMSKEDLKLWMQTAPADQRLERVHNAKLSLSNVVNARYDIDGISREDLELWHQFAPPDQKLEAGSDTEIEMDEMNSEPVPDIPKLDLRALEEATLTEVRRVSTSSIEQSNSMQVNHFIRRHSFLQTSLVRHTTSERRSFERDIYDYARGLGLATGEARKEVLKGRGFCGEEEYNSDDTALGAEVDDSAVTLRRLSSPSVSLLEQPLSSLPCDVSAKEKAPRERNRRKKQSKPEPSAQVNAQDVIVEAEVSVAQLEVVEVPPRRSKSSKETTSKFFPKEPKQRKKRKRESADETVVPAKKKPKKEAKKKKSKKVDGQATANTQVDPEIPSAYSTSNSEGHGKGGEISPKSLAPTDDLEEGREDADTVGAGGKAIADGKSREKRKKRKDKSKGPRTTTATTSTNTVKSIGIVVAAEKASDVNDVTTTGSNTDDAVNGSLQEQQSSAIAHPVKPSEAGGDDDLEPQALAAARKLRKQKKRIASKGKNKRLSETEKAAVVSPPATKSEEPDKPHESPDDHPINQITGLPAPSINDLMGIPGPSNGHGPSSTAFAMTNGPNDPKSNVEARRNLLRSAKREPVEYGMTANTSKQELKEIKNSPLLEVGAGESQADEEHAAKKRRRKRKSEHGKELTADDASSDNVKTKKGKQVKTEVGPIPREPGFQSPMIQ